MKYWALGLVFLGGCSNQVGQYQSSAAERFNAESEAYERIHQRLNDFGVLRANERNGEGSEETIRFLKDNQDFYEDLKAADAKQEKRMQAALKAIAEQ